MILTIVLDESACLINELNEPEQCSLFEALLRGVRRSLNNIQVAFVFAGHAMAHVARCFHRYVERYPKQRLINVKALPVFSRLILTDLALANSEYQTKLKEFYDDYKKSIANRGL
jgi:hypothetical protein